MPYSLFSPFCWRHYLWRALLIGSAVQAAPPTPQPLLQAERLFAEQLYRDALPLYEGLIDTAQSEDLKEQLLLRLATCQLEIKNSQGALSLLSPCNSEALYLMSLAYKQEKQFSAALALLNETSLFYGEDRLKRRIDLERGSLCLALGDDATAQKILENISWDKVDCLPYQLAQLQLAKIHLREERWAAARHLLSSLFPNFPSLQVEKMYLIGLAALGEGDDLQAIACLEELLPQAFATDTALSRAILHNLASAYLRQALKPEEAAPLLFKAAHLIQELLKKDPGERTYTLSNNLLLIRAKKLADSAAYLQAKQSFLCQEKAYSPVGKRIALLKFAEAAPTYEERQSLYTQILASSHPPEFLAEAWFLKGMNDFDQSIIWQKQHQIVYAHACLKQASEAFGTSASFPSPLQTEAIKYQAIACALQKEQAALEKAWELLSRLPDSGQETACLAGWVALQLPGLEKEEQAIKWLQESRANAPPSSWSLKSMKLEGLLYLQRGDWEQADALFAALTQNQTYMGEAWFWRAHCAEQGQQRDLKQRYLQQAYQSDPQSPYAPLAFFYLYPYRDYMRGHRKAIKHLQSMPLAYPIHPLLITAHYLIGLDHKKDHLSEEGQIVRRKDLTSAIDAFQLAESTFDALYAKQLIPSANISYYLQVRYQAQLERAQANFAIAQQAKGGKREIYLEYAEGVFKKLIEDFSTPSPLIKTWLGESKIWAEAEFKLALTLIERKKDEEAEKILDNALKHYQAAGIEQGWQLAKVWFEKGKLAQAQKNYHLAMECLVEAENTAGNFSGLSPDEKLDIWIQQSLCCKALNQLEGAMRLLSKVINDDVISALRIKAMYLRAEIYELENRPELALKQLEAAANKGGVWAEKAQAKLKQTYGY